jgi:hypothetical protein
MKNIGTAYRIPDLDVICHYANCTILTKDPQKKKNENI